MNSVIEAAAHGMVVTLRENLRKFDARVGDPVPHHYDDACLQIGMRVAIPRVMSEDQDLLMFVTVRGDAVEVAYPTLFMMWNDGRLKCYMWEDDFETLRNASQLQGPDLVIPLADPECFEKVATAVATYIDVLVIAYHDGIGPTVDPERVRQIVATG